MQLIRPYGISANDLLYTLGLLLLLIAPYLLEIPLLVVPLFIAVSASLMLVILGGSIKGIHLVYLLLFLTFLMPPMDIVEELPVFRIEQFFFLIVFPLVIYFQGYRVQEHHQSLVRAFSLFLAYMVFSLFYGFFFKEVTTGYKDLAELIRVSQYLIAAFLISNFTLTDLDFRRIMKTMVVLFVASAVIGLFQYYSILNLDSITAPYYSEGRHWSVNIRMYGTFINPNTYGTFLSIGMLLCTGLFLYSKTSLHKTSFGLSFLILFWAMVLTESRTALIALIMGHLVFMLAYSHFIGKDLKKALLPLLGFTILFILLFLILRADLIARYSTLLNIMADESWQIRLFVWAVNLEVFQNSWLFGYGPSLHQFTPTVDNDYLLILRRYGIIGFLLYLNLYWVSFKRSIHPGFERNYYSLFRVIFLAALTAFLVGNLTNQIFHEMQFMAFWAVLLGLLFNKTPVSRHD